MNPSSLLLPGDCLLYSPSSILDWLVAVKTWTRITHVEFFRGGGTTIGSRNGIGVEIYPLRLDHLACVRRPSRGIPFNVIAGMRWFETVRGQKYDWLGLLCFTLAVKQGSPDRMFCSEFGTRFYRQCGFDAVSPSLDADTVAPSEFYQSATLRTIWHEP